MLRPATHVGDLSDLSSITAMWQSPKWSRNKEPKGTKSSRTPKWMGCSMWLFGLRHIFFQLSDPLLLPMVERMHPCIYWELNSITQFFINSNIFRWDHTGQWIVYYLNTVLSNLNKGFHLNHRPSKAAGAWGTPVLKHSHKSRHTWEGGPSIETFPLIRLVCGPVCGYVVFMIAGWFRRTSPLWAEPFPGMWA